MTLAPPQSLNQKKILRFSGHVNRVIAVLDQLYEFGPSAYYSSVKTKDDAYLEFEAALSGLDIESLNIGLDRLRNIVHRKRLTPSPISFTSICKCSEYEWELMKDAFEKAVE